MKRLILVGGGHSHLEVVRQFGTRAPAADVSLVDPARFATYSGMVPGLIAGHYALRECQIDLESLATRMGIEFVNRRVCAIDPAQRMLALDDGSSLVYDFISLDVGSAPSMAGIAGAREHAITVRPFSHFVQHWDRLLAGARSGKVKNIVIVGGGAAGVELALAMQYRIAPVAAGTLFTLVTAEGCLLPDHNPRVRVAIDGILNRRGIAVRLDAAAARVSAQSVMLRDNTELASDATIWVTGAAAPEWLTHTGLPLDEGGFLSARETLASISHGNVFAVGDCATIAGHAYPKSGVYAVRQGPVLAENLRRALDARPLTRYRPQRKALALISAGNRYAIASYGSLTLQGGWVWQWKDYIDRRFVHRFRT